MWIVLVLISGTCARSIWKSPSLAAQRQSIITLIARNFVSSLFFPSISRVVLFPDEQNNTTYAVESQLRLKINQRRFSLVRIRKLTTLSEFRILVSEALREEERKTILPLRSYRYLGSRILYNFSLPTQQLNICIKVCVIPK